MKTKRQLRSENEELKALLLDVTEKAEALLPRVEAMVRERDSLRADGFTQVKNLQYNLLDAQEQIAALEAEVYDLECQLNDLEYEIDEDEGCLPYAVPARPDQDGYSDPRWQRYDPTEVPFA